LNKEDHMTRETIRSEVAGSVWKIVASPGDVLEADGTLLIIESMKMEIPAQLSEGGRIVQLLVTEGESVREGQELAIVEI
jgi:acetyl-CoA carboxylase biotin carboxyl carrier protein